MTWPDCHSRDHWPYSRHRWVLAALTTLARSSVLAASLAHTFLISTIQWITVKELVPAADSLSSGVFSAVESRLSWISIKTDLRYDGRYHENCEDDCQSYQEAFRLFGDVNFLMSGLMSPQRIASRRTIIISVKRDNCCHGG